MLLLPLAPHHLNAVAAIERESFSDPWPEVFFEDELRNPDSVFLVGVKDGEIVCYGGLRKIAGEGEIINIAVSKKSLRRGFGREMLRALLAAAEREGLSKLYLEVRAGNEAAKHLYLKEGFQPDGVRRGYYSSPDEDALLMHKLLTRDLGDLNA